MDTVRWMEVEIEKLVPAAWNYKTDDELKKEALKNNIKRNGQVENIIIRELETGFYEVVNGNHRLEVFLELEFKKVVAYNLGVISQAAAQRIAVETNETHFEANAVKLAQVIKEITDAYPIEDLVETMPYTSDEIERMKKSLDFSWGQFQQAQMRTITIGVEKDRFSEFSTDLEPVLSKYKEVINVEWGWD